MNCPDKITSAEEWLHYIDGTATSADRVALEAHIGCCPNCRQVLEHLISSRNRLVAAARAERTQVAIHPTALGRLWDNLRFRIRRSDEIPAAEPALDLLQLRSILTSMCGEATAEGALHHSLANDGRFAKNLGSIVEVMCGSRAARFVEHAAQSTRKDLVA